MKVSELTEEQKRTIADEILGTCDTNSKTTEELWLDGEQVDEVLASANVSSCELCSWFFEEGELWDSEMSGRFLCEECRESEKA